nr:leucine-rich repeat protein [uncultured Ruminococcus sp.]
MLKCKIKLKNSLSVILSVLIVISAALCVPVTASAATYDSNPDDFEFSYNSSDMTASVTKYKGDSEYVEIPSMVNGYKVDSIGNPIFRDNYKLKGVIIPDTVDYVSREIFSGCVSLTDVDLGKGITSISFGMFYNCKSLESLTIPEQIEYLGGYEQDPFDGCTSLKNLYLKAKNISFIRYLKLPSLTNIVIASSVDSLPDGAFSGYNYIENVTFENGLMVLPDSCFKNCTSLKNITLPDSMMSVGKSAFENCFNLKSVTFSKNLNTISPSAFKGCSSIQSLNFNDNLREIGSNAFENCTSVKNVTFNNLLNTIGESAFSNCTSIEKAELPSSVSSLGENAFAGCTELKNVTLSEKLKYISSGAFSDCSSLESIDLPDNITGIGSGSFLNCTALQNVKIGKNTTSIENYAFSGCSSLKNIEIPANVKYIWWAAFEDCTNLSSVKLNNGLQQLDNYVFYNCLNLKKIIIPASVTYLSDYSLGYYGKNDNNYKIPDFVIVGDINSCAQRYANDNGFKFEKYKVNLSTPQITSLKNTTGGVKITWNKVDGAYGYRLYYRPASGGWKRFKDTTATSYTDSSVVPNKTETYTIRCIDKNGNTISGYNSNGWSIKYTPVAPTISKLENTSGGIKLTWNKIAGVYGYRLYRKTSTGWKRFKDTTSTNFTDSGVTANKTETYTIRCIDKNSNTVSGFNSKGWSKKYTASTPSISKLENVSGGIKISWNKVAGVYGYRLYHKTSSGWKRFKDTTATTYTDSAVKSGRTETYTIRCIDRNGKTVSGYNSKGWSKKYVYNPPKSIKLNKTSAYIGKKESVTLKYTLSAGSTSTVTWSSSNKNVATVSGGKVTAKGAGATTITATTANGKKATCKVTVINGVRTYYTCTSGNRTVAEYSVVVSDGCYDKKSSGGWRCYYEKYNYDKYDMGYVGAILFTKSPYSQSSPPAPNFTKLGEKNGYVFGYTKATGLEFIADDITSAKKYSTACQNFNYAVKTFRFE